MNISTTCFQTPKRPASESEPTPLVSPPRRKLLKTNQQKENGRTSSSSSSSAEAAASSYLLVPITSTNSDEPESNSNEPSTSVIGQAPAEDRMETDEIKEGENGRILIDRKMKKERNGMF